MKMLKRKSFRDKNSKKITSTSVVVVVVVVAVVVAARNPNTMN